MEKHLNNRLNQKEYKNWLKVSIALLHSKEALHGIAKEVVEKVHGAIKLKTGSSQCDGTCKTNKGKEPNCRSCLQWVKEIKSYNKGQLNWKNTEPKIWHEEPWEIAKCFMNPQGSKSAAQSNTGPEKTDLSGILNLVINCKEFKTYFKDTKLPEKVREIRNKVMHSAGMKFTDAEVKEYFQNIISLLEDEMTLKSRKVCKDKVSLLESLRDGGLEIRPEQEFNCIDDALSVHERLFDSGIDDAKLQSFEILNQFIAKHKDLEDTFQSKLEEFKNITDNLTKRISSQEIKYGELCGKIEWLEDQVTRLKSCDNGPNKIQSPETFMWKNSLQFYTQKKKLELPKYSSTRTESGKYTSMVRVADKEFPSKQPKGSKKEAEQSAANRALDFFSSLETSKEVDATPVLTQNPNPVSPEEKTGSSKSSKNLLQEYAQKKGVPLPLYDTKKQDNGFLATVLVDGMWFSPETVPKPRKIDAEQDAARLALAYLDCHVSLPLCKHSDGSVDKGTSGNHDAPEAGNTSTTLTGKPFKSILNEYCQKSSEIVDLPTYKTDLISENDHISTVTINGRIYKSSSKKGTKKESEESAAQEACRKFGILNQGDHPSNGKHEDTVSSPRETQSTGWMANNPPSCFPKSPEGDTFDRSSPPLAEKSTPPNNVSKSYKSILNEYVQACDKTNTVKYDEASNSKQGKYIWSVKINENIYTSQSPKNSKKEAQESAAKVACFQLQLVTEDVKQVDHTPPDLKWSNGSLPEPSRSIPKSDETIAESNTSMADTIGKVSACSSSVAGCVAESQELDRSCAVESFTPYTNDGMRINEKPIACNISSLIITDKNQSQLNEHLQDSAEQPTCEEGGQVTLLDAKYPSTMTKKGENETSQGAGPCTSSIPPLLEFPKPVSNEDIQQVDGEIGANPTVQEGKSHAETVPAITNFKGTFAEYVKKFGENPRYVTVETGRLEFRSRVFLGYRCFKGDVAKKKKSAEHSAAKAALEELKSSKSGSKSSCRNILEEYHEKLNTKSPSYMSKTSPEKEKYAFIVSVVKKWTVCLGETRTGKEEVKKALVEEALRDLKDEGKDIQKIENKSVIAQFNEFCQKQRGAPKFEYNITGEQASFSGDLCFFTMEKYESLCPQPSEEEAKTSAAVSACNDLGLTN